MDPNEYYGVLSLVPASIAIFLAFLTRNTIFSLVMACLIGVVVSGQGLMGFPNLLKNALGNTNFSWVLLLEFFIGISIAFFQRTGAIANFSQYIAQKKMTRIRVQLIAWFMGMFVYFSDYFSPLICDSTAAPVSILVPITGWAVLVASLLIGMGPIQDIGQAMQVFIIAIPFNIYAILAVLMVGLVAINIIPDFGPMKKAEERALNENKVLRDGADPLMGVELTNIQPYENIKTSLFWNFIFPVCVVISFAVGSFIITSSAKPMEAFMLSSFVAGLIMRIQGVPLKEIINTAMLGIKGIMPAIIILALAYSLNDLSAMLNTAGYIVSITESWLTSKVLPMLAFLITAIVAFSTGTSWGTYAIMIPIAVPLAFNFSGGELDTIVYATIAAVAGGGVFGDHCSPLSDTSILASTGAASDHIDHIKTQMPYALLIGFISVLIYLGVGWLL